MGRSTVGRVACAALLLVAGCDMTLPWRSGSSPEAPSGFTVQPDPYDFDVVSFSWTPQSAIDGYELQGRVGEGAWETMLAGIPAGVVGASVRFPPEAPELASYEFRLRALAASRPSSWSDAASFLRGVRPPSLAADLPMGWGLRSGPIAVSWTSASRVATDLLLERATLEAGISGTWSVIEEAAPLAAGTYLDRLLEDGHAYAYRARVGVGGTWSAPSEARTPPVDVAAPWGVRAVKVDGGVQLSWTNQSTTATTLRVSAYTGFPAEWTTLVPAFVSSCVLATSVWPATRFAVAAQREPDPGWAESERTRIEPFAVSVPPAMATSVVRGLPGGEWAARDSDGRFHFAAQDGMNAAYAEIHRADATGYDPHFLATYAAIFPPGVVLDGHDRPHTAFARFDGTPYVDIVHVWWDGATWDSEVVGTDELSWANADTRSGFGLGLDGALQLVYLGKGGVTHVLREAGASTTTILTTLSPSPGYYGPTPAFGVGPDGTSYVAQTGYSASHGANVLLLSERSPAGEWAESIVPAGTVPQTECLAVAAGSSGDVALAFCGTGDEVVVVRRMAGVWQTPELVFTKPWDGRTVTFVFAGSPDLEWLALSMPSEDVTKLFVRGPSGWNGIDAGPYRHYPGWVGAGAGGLWALYEHGNDLEPPWPVLFSLFEQTP